MALLLWAWLNVPGLLALRSGKRQIKQFPVERWWDLRGKPFLSPEDQAFRKFLVAYFAIGVGCLMGLYGIVYGLVQLSNGHIWAPP